MTKNELTGLAKASVGRGHRGAQLVFAVVTTVAVVAMTWGTDSAAVERPDRAASVGALDTRSDIEPSRSPVEPVAAPAPAPTGEIRPTVARGPIEVADPRPGDLRVDASADVLPIEYVPPAAADVFLDVAYGALPAQRLDLYLPADHAAPVVVYVHSGGWIEGDKAEVPDMVLRFVERGYAVASVGYRLAPEHHFPAPIVDVKLALRWVKAYGADEGRVDGDRIVLYGTSAGGHLASFVAATPGLYEPGDLDVDLAAFDSTVTGVVSVVGPADLVSLHDHGNAWAQGFTRLFLGCDPCAPELLEAASPTHHVHPDLPPAYWAYGTEDELIDSQTQGLAIATTWAAEVGGGASLLDLVDGQGHNVDESTINQRAVETFVDAAVSRAVGDAETRAISF